MTHETACIVALIGNIVAVGGARPGEEASIPSVTRTKALALGSYIVTCVGGIDIGNDGWICFLFP